MTRLRYFIDPVDVLFLRGNRLFGDPGSFGESSMPPWPSVAAGAIRSALLAERGYDAAAFARGDVKHDKELGTPQRPGTFTMTGFDIARRYHDGRVETVRVPPADLAIHTVEGGLDVHRIAPNVSSRGILSSASTAYLAVLPEPQRGKPAPSRLLNQSGWIAYLLEREVAADRHLVPIGDLWATDLRTGIAIDPVKRRAADHALFTSAAVAPRKREHVMTAHRPSDGAPWPFDVGFLAEVAGVDLRKGEGVLTLRFGGDGRAARATRIEDSTSAAPNTDELHRAIARAKRCRLILTTPGLFTGGWRPTGVTAHGTDLRLNLHGVRGRLICAAVPRAEVVSGFDIAHGCPKPAQRVAPAGSVYWLDELEATPETLGALNDCGLWSDPEENPARRAEGFNRLTFAEWQD